MRHSTRAARLRARARATPLLGIAAVTFSACNVPNFKGPQVQGPPQGFLLAPDSYQQRRLFPERELVFHSAWVESMRDFSTIYIDGYAGVLGLEDAVAARDSIHLRSDDPDTRFGEVEPLTVDGRQAFGWAERVETPRWGLVWVAYRAVVPYDTVTYTVEFYSGDPSIKPAAPDTLKAVISTFAVGETTYNLPLIALLIGVVLFGAAFVRSKRQERAARLRAINLVKVPKKKSEEQAAAEAPIPSWKGPAAPPS